MKKNFKKSKFVILPALATLVLTGVASVTGTVAWFTANRAVTTTISSFNTAVLTSDLSLTYIGESDSGTKTPDSGKTISIEGELTHGSYDAKENYTGNLYVANLNDNGQVTSYENLKTLATSGENAHVENVADEETQTTTTVNHWLARKGAGAEKDVWYGVSWKMKFEGASKVDGKKNYLLLDPSSNVTTFEDIANTTGTTMDGLRIALMTDKKVLVISGDDTSSHVKAGTTIPELDTVGFDSNNFFKVGSESNYTKLNDNDTQLGNETSPYKYDFGEIGTDGLILTCVAWYEGTDSAITTKEDLKLSNVKTTFGFYSRTK